MSMSESSADMLDQQLHYASIDPEYLEGLRASHAAAKDDPEKMFQYALVGADNIPCTICASSYIILSISLLFSNHY